MEVKLNIIYRPRSWKLCGNGPCICDAAKSKAIFLNGQHFAPKSQFGLKQGCWWCGDCSGRDVFRSISMPTIAQLEIDGRILALLGGYVWDLGLFDDGVVHGGVGTCTPQHWSKRHSTHVRRFVVAATTMNNKLDALNMRHNTPIMGLEVTRAFL